MEQLLIHILADYCLQSDWMALNKNKKTIPCLVHVIIYTSCFLFLTTSWKALLFIGVTHFIFDRFPIIIKRMIWIRNHLNPTLEYYPYKNCSRTGYLDDETILNSRPFFITIWLYIITDNFLHLTCNYIALTYLS